MNNTANAEFQDHHFAELRDLIYEHTGIKLADTKKELVHRRFTSRLKSLQLTSFDEYLELVRSGDQDEMVEFSNAITTNLTSFFRENHHFDYLRKECFPELKEKHKRDKKIRIWSAGCSTGPEPYSIAMVLREAIPDIAKWDVKILATDLDTNCLQTAADGTYTEKVVETVSNDRLKKFFDESHNGKETVYQAKSSLKSLIRFKPLNLLTPFPFKGKFDVIFCRNVFIYFDKPTQQVVVEKYAQYQNEGASLIIGHSENLHGLSDIYELGGQTIYRRLA